MSYKRLRRYEESVHFQCKAEDKERLKMMAEGMGWPMAEAARRAMNEGLSALAERFALRREGRNRGAPT